MALFTREESWQDTREEENARKCVVFEEACEKGRQGANIQLSPLESYPYSTETDTIPFSRQNCVQVFNL